MDNKAFKTRIGGQALIEGIAMKGPKNTCMAVRKPDGEIYTEITPTAVNPLKKVPILRGAAAMIISLISGFTFINRSAEIAFPDGEADDKFDRWIKERFGDKAGSTVTAISSMLGVVLAVGLFILLPTVLTKQLSRIAPISGAMSVVEGLIKILIFLGYLFLVTRIKDVRRVFEYHGAEHKTIACYEHRDELTPEAARRYSRFHPRCGTSFLFIVIIISILVGSFIPWGSTLVRSALKLLALPIIMGVSYEIIQYSGAHENILSRVLSAPGMWIQRLTAFEPDDAMLEVAITSLKAVLPDSEEDAEW